MSKSYRSRPALDQVDLEIPAGSIGVLLGPNGAGKSTLLQCLATMVRPDAGEIFFDGQRLTRENVEQRRALMFLPDQPFLYQTDTPLEHLALVLRAYGHDPAPYASRAVELLERLDMLPRIDSLCCHLSRGQMYKVALCGLLLVSPSLWLLDEPFASGMDAEGLDLFRAEARAAADQGATVIYSTQILEVAEAFGDWFAIMGEGWVDVVTRTSSTDSMLEVLRERMNGAEVEQ